MCIVQQPHAAAYGQRCPRESKKGRKEAYSTFIVSEGAQAPAVRGLPPLGSVHHSGTVTLSAVSGVVAAPRRDIVDLRHGAR